VVRGRIAIIYVAVLLAACAGADGSSPTAIPTFPVDPERLATAVDAAPEAKLTCGFPDRTFPADRLDQPTNAWDQSGPIFDALHEAVDLFDFAGDLGELGWFVAQQDDSGALFVARGDADPAWWYVVVEKDGSAWKPGGMGGCGLNVQLSDEFLPAQWSLDPDYPAPTSSSTELHILVWELACHDEYAATGRTSAPVVVYGAETLTVTIGVRPLEGAHTCPGTPGTPAILTLPKELDGRTLLDGYTYPPVEPSPAFPIEGSSG
jgi:hypothetical protein